IEEMVVVVADYTHSLQQLAYKELVERQEYLKKVADCQEHINDLEQEEKEYYLQEAINTEMLGLQELYNKARKEKKIAEILRNGEKDKKIIQTLSFCLP